MPIYGTVVPSPLLQRRGLAIHFTWLVLESTLELRRWKSDVPLFVIRGPLGGLSADCPNLCRAGLLSTLSKSGSRSQGISAVKSTNPFGFKTPWSPDAAEFRLISTLIVSAAGTAQGGGHRHAGCGHLSSQRGHICAVYGAKNAGPCSWCRCSVALLGLSKASDCGKASAADCLGALQIEFGLFPATSDNRLMSANVRNRGNEKATALMLVRSLVGALVSDGNVCIAGSRGAERGLSTPDTIDPEDLGLSL